MTTDYTARWKSGEGLSAHIKILRAIQGKQFDGALTPFGKVGGYHDMRGFPVGSLREIAGCSFRDVDLTKADFKSVRIESCEFTNAKFDRADLSGSCDFGSRFERCSFVRTSFRRATLGCQGTHFIDSTFDRCICRGVAFVRAEFDRCGFKSCDLKGVDFNGSSFVETAFEGKLQDVWFRGGFPYPSDVENFGTPRKNVMLRVSFAEAELWWVTFSNDCDLSTITLPSDGRHRLYDHWKQRLESANSVIAGWVDEDRIPASNYVRSFQAHAKTQHWYILNSREVADELGDDIGRRVLESLGPPVSPTPGPTTPPGGSPA